jgi:hypothetical protein
MVTDAACKCAHLGTGWTEKRDDSQIDAANKNYLRNDSDLDSDLGFLPVYFKNVFLSFSVNLGYEYDGLKSVVGVPMKKSLFPISLLSIEVFYIDAKLVGMVIFCSG